MINRLPSAPFLFMLINLSDLTQVACIISRYATGHLQQSASWSTNTRKRITNFLHPRACIPIQTDSITRIEFFCTAWRHAWITAISDARTLLKQRSCICRGPQKVWTSLTCPLQHCSNLKRRLCHKLYRQSMTKTHDAEGPIADEYHPKKSKQLLWRGTFAYAHIRNMWYTMTSEIYMRAGLSRSRNNQTNDVSVSQTWNNQRPQTIASQRIVTACILMPHGRGVSAHMDLVKQRLFMMLKGW